MIRAKEVEQLQTHRTHYSVRQRSRECALICLKRTILLRARVLVLVQLTDAFCDS